MATKRTDAGRQRREAADKAFPWRVDQPVVKGLPNMQAMMDWCRANAPMSAMAMHGDFTRWYFVEEGDAGLFQFTWGGTLASAGFATFRPAHLGQQPMFSTAPARPHTIDFGAQKYSTP